MSFGDYDHNCILCPLHDVGNKWVCLPGKGDPASRAIIVGEAPGATEDEQGKPFVGMSGNKVNSALAKVGIGPEDLFVTNTVKCRPPGNRTPTALEIQACFRYLWKEVDLIQPTVIMPLGNPAMQAVLKDKSGITRKAGLWRRIDGTKEDDILVIPNFHPAYISRYPDKQDFFEEIVADFIQVWKYSLNHTIDETWRYAKP